MSPESIIGAVGIYVGTLVIGAVSSIIPIISIEVFLVALALAGRIEHAVPLVLLATLGQVLGKLPIYYGARGLASMPGRHRPWLERFRRWTEKLGNRPLALIGTSAFVGLPPFSICSTAAGALAIEIRAFCLVVAAGRGARFAVLIALAS
jgi:membrane protein YqaA with SNARE-associated domain